ncbi:phage terminase large subunit family protein [Chelatococcus reniformis]|uniref:Terminase n=1 Tax=Chelatococcus reniformis TaxID=1494448 RepID=A0A916UE30_9HYPH|nr:phage terminase large subunit family protein [Chelatococcus reniformis]GGC68496.1 terminase [Chelatococcus reniformis]
MTTRLAPLVRQTATRWKPPPKLTVSQWADRERRLSPESSAAPGRWVTATAEYQRGIMDALSDPTVQAVVVPKASQVGWTEILNNIIGFHIDQDAAPMLLIQPTLEMGEAWSKDRLAPMLRDTPALAGKVKDPRARDSGNTLLHKVFPGGHVSIVGANSPASLASRPIRVVLADEVDRYPASAGSEGDPLKLAAKRQTTFWNRKTLLGSTPTLKATSIVWREWERSDQRRFMVPCPHCKAPQHLKWSQVHWDKTKDAEGQTIAHHPETAGYACEACGVIWTDVERWAALRRGKWAATAAFAGIAGFHVPGFLSPWLTLEQIVREFIEAKDHPELLQVWVNTVLGEPWEEQGEGANADDLLNRGEAYDSDSLPDQALVFTVGVDVQGDRLEAQGIAWGAHEEAWVVFYEVLFGDPAQAQVWKDLDELLMETFHTEAGRRLRVRAACIDTGGHHAAQVLSFCRTRRGRRIFPTKGMAGARPIWPKWASKTKTKDSLFIVGVDTAKESIYGRLRNTKPGAGYIHFPKHDDFGPAYFAQLTSEQVVTRFRHGRPFRAWVLPPGKRNEALDTAVLALAALRSLPFKLDKIARAAAPDPEPEGKTPTETPPADEVPIAVQGEAVQAVPRGRRQGFLSRRQGWLSPR